ncbi:prealbumin-like fold domain-containing protein, partial [Thomasclavelia ramosa]
TAKDDTQAVVYEGVAYKNERQKISIFIEKKDAVTEEKLEGVIFGLYAREDILSQQGEVLVEKDTLLEKKATDENGQLTFDSDLYHGKYYVKEEV